MRLCTAGHPVEARLQCLHLTAFLPSAVVREASAVHLPWHGAAYGARMARDLACCERAAQECSTPTASSNDPSHPHLRRWNPVYELEVSRATARQQKVSQRPRTATLKHRLHREPAGSSLCARAGTSKLHDLVRPDAMQRPAANTVRLIWSHYTTSEARGLAQSSRLAYNPYTNTTREAAALGIACQRTVPSWSPTSSQAS